MLFASIIFEKNISDDVLSDIPYILATVVVEKIEYIFYSKTYFWFKTPRKGHKILKKNP